MKKKKKRKMDKNSKEKLILASLSELMAEKNETIYKIQSLLDSDFDETRDDVGLLTEYFEKLSQQELAIDTVQVFFARHFEEPDSKVEPEKPDSDDNPS
jgi:hypothetical protein